jgi:dCTP deaminase
VLSDRDIVREVEGQAGLVIEPFDPDAVQPNSVDLRLSNRFRHLSPPDRSYGTPLDPLNLPAPEEYTWEQTLDEGQTMLMPPGGFVLGSTVERVEIPATMAALLDGRSSLGRLGLVIHVTAGFFDAGFRGVPTLEIANIGPRPLLLTPGMRIAQMSFHYLNSTAQRPYGHPDLGSHYQDQGASPVPSQTL